jgi:hypothetical protein
MQWDKKMMDCNMIDTSCLLWFCILGIHSVEPQHIRLDYYCIVASYNTWIYQKARISSYHDPRPLSPPPTHPHQFLNDNVERQ